MTPSNCPFLGKLDDPETSLNYPTLWNCCHKVNPVVGVDPEFQDSHCLTPEFNTCPVYQRQQIGPMPIALRAEAPPEPETSLRDRVWPFSPVLGIGLVVLLIVGGFLLTNFLGIFQNSFFTDEEQPTSTEIPVNLTETPTRVSENAVPDDNDGPIATGTPTPAISSTPLTTSISCIPPNSWVSIILSDSDTLEILSAVYGVSGEELARVNCVQTESELSVGLTFFVPFITATPVIPPTATITCGAPDGWVIYVVQQNDTLFELSQAFGVSVAQLQLANCLGSSSIIQAGQRLYVPNVPTVTVPLPTATTTPQPTSTFTVTPSPTPSNTPGPTSTNTSTSTPGATVPPRPTPTPTLTETPLPPTVTSPIDTGPTPTATFEL